jgi:hypothetical protein
MTCLYRPPKASSPTEAACITSWNIIKVHKSWHKTLFYKCICLLASSSWFMRSFTIVAHILINYVVLPVLLMVIKPNL